MALEKKFEGVKLTEREFRKLKRDALNEQFKKIKEEKEKPLPQEKINDYSKPTYDIVAVETLFKGTDISEEVISQELKKIQAKKGRKKNLPLKIKQVLNRSLRPVILGACIGAVVGLGGAGVYKGLNGFYKFLKFNDLYDITLRAYGDIDKNGIVTPYEEDTFKMNVLKDKNLNYEFGGRMLWARYSNGKIVSLKDLSQWLREYDQKKSSDKI